jgi:hypothetical protein
MANTANARFFLSVHLNGFSDPSVNGTETFALSPGGQGELLARAVQRSLVPALGLRDRDVKFNNSWVVLRDTRMPAILAEPSFITNRDEESRLRDDAYIQQIAGGIAQGVLDHLGIKSEAVAPPIATGSPIMGKSVVTSEEMAAFLLSRNTEPKLNCDPKFLAALYISEGAAEGVRGDVAFCQAIHETGWFNFRGDVRWEQNNFAGIGATGGGAGGASFASPMIGVRAQIHHLKAYASAEPLANPNESPRFHLVTRGIAPTWEALNGRWAVPGDRYGQMILGLHDLLIEFADATSTEPIAPPPALIAEHWAEKYRKELQDAGVLLDGGRYDDPVTRGEMFAMLAKYHRAAGR